MNNSVTQRPRLIGLDPTTFAHPLDRSALQVLQKFKGFDRAAAKLLEWHGERGAYVELNASGIRVTTRQLPGLHDLLVEASRVLDMEVPEMFVRPGALNAYTSGHNNPYVVLTTGLVESLTDAELTALIAHELGHIKCSHVLYKTMMRAVTEVGAASAMAATNPVTLVGSRVALALLRRALAHWDRCSELSADRAAMLVAQDEETCLRMMLKLAGAPSRLIEQLDTTAFLEQATHLADLTANSRIARLRRSSMVRSSTHPLTVERARQLHLWINDGGYASVLADPASGPS